MSKSEYVARTQSLLPVTFLLMARGLALAYIMYINGQPNNTDTVFAPYTGHWVKSSSDCHPPMLELHKPRTAFSRWRIARSMPGFISSKFAIGMQATGVGNKENTSRSGLIWN